MTYHIIWLIQGDEGFGVARAIESLAGEVARQGQRVSVVCFDDGAMAARCEALGLHVVRLGVGRVPGLGGGLVEKVKGAARLRAYERRVGPVLGAALRQLSPEVLHFLWPSFVGVAGRAAKALGVPCFWEMPNALTGRLPMGINRRWYQVRCWRYGITPLANSAYTAGTLGDSLVRPVVFHLGADEAIFDPRKVSGVTRSELGIPEAASVLGVVARLDASKGQSRLLDAMMRLVDEGEDLHLLLLGGPTDGTYAQGLREVGKDRVHLAGRVPDPQRYYGAMDVAVNCRVDAEPFGLSVIEAMMMGVPVLVHALGGPAETVADGQAGWHVHEPSVDGFEAGLRRVLADRERWDEMGAAARQRALERFTLQGQAERYLQLVQASFAS